MSDLAISVEGLGKKYRLGQQSNGARYRTLREDLVQGVGNLFRRGALSKKPDDEFWALRNISFQVHQGEVVGIIGRNGAGKSTLLKILSRITDPTTGKVRIRGRVASLLEVGTGFHQELTGRENIYLNGAILGMSHAEIKAKFDEIVAFAEIEKFLDTPVKRYSSGMYVRLAFAVAAHLDPEILIVDEVLAVGDAEFQKKCLGKMQDVSRGGRTVLFVSHNMPAVARLTHRCILLSEGTMILNRSTAEAVQHYLQAITEKGNTCYDLTTAQRPYRGTQAATLISAAFTRSKSCFDIGEDIPVDIRVQANVRVADLRFSMTVCSADGAPIGSTSCRHAIAMAAGELSALRVRLPYPRLAPGRYYCLIAIGTGYGFEERVDFDIVPNVLHFEVSSTVENSGAVAYWNNDWGKILLPDMELDVSSSLCQPPCV